MKLKLTIITVLFLACSLGAFGQKTPPPPKTSLPRAVMPVKVPTVKQILDKYVAAIGGRTAYEKIKTRFFKGTIEISPMGIKGTVESSAAAPNKTYTKANLSGIGDLIDGFDGTNGWSINPIQGNHDKTNEELAQAKILNDFYREINLDKLYSNLTFKGTEKVGENTAYVITGTPAGLEPETFYFDTTSGYLLRSDATIISPEGKMPTKTFYEDVREVDGIKLPFRSRVVLPQYELITVLTEVKNNPPISDSQFVKPKN